MRRIWAVFFILTLFIGTAGAYWMYYEENEGPFADDPLRMMITGDKNGGLAFVCTRERGLEALYMLPKKADPKTLAAINQLKPHLVLWVDGEKFSFPAEAVDNQGNQAFSARVSRKIVTKAGKAKKHITAGIILLGEIIHKHSFPVHGSGTASRVLMENCHAE